MASVRFHRLVRWFVAPAAATAMLAAGATPAAADTKPAYERRYAVQVVKFKAGSETGPDWAGSDEVYVYTEDQYKRGYGHNRTQSKRFNNVDTGDTRTLPADQSCITPTSMLIDHDTDGRLEGFSGDSWTCAYAASPLSFRITLWEYDSGPIRWPGDGYSQIDYDGALTVNDDLIGSKVFTFTDAYLTTNLPDPGRYVDHTQKFEESGRYYVTFRITRVI